MSQQSTVSTRPASPLRRLLATSGRFLAVGALSSVIEIGSFNALLWLGWGAVWAKVGATAIATVNAYFGNRQWAFGSRAHRGRTAELMLFLVANAACLGLGVALVWAGDALVAQATGQPAGPLVINLVNILSIGLTTLARFVLYHWVVFPVGPKPAADEKTTTAA
ncbi:MAG: GtrA family protein [Pseudoclavibacter caeni]|jgi:putative flippase GtrA